MLQNILNKIKALPDQVYSMSPVGVGVCIGYFGHPMIKVGASAAMGLVKGLLKI